MSIDIKYLPGTWRRVSRRGFTNTLILTADGKYTFHTNQLIAQLIVGEMSGRWVTDGRKLMVRRKPPGTWVMRKTRGNWGLIAASYLENTFKIPEGKSINDNTYEIVELTSDKLILRIPPSIVAMRRGNTLHYNRVQ